MSANATEASAESFTTIAAFDARAWFLRLAAVAAVGICIGAIIGGALFQVLSSATTATAFIRITQPPDLVAIAGGAGQTTPNTMDNNERYVAGEVSYLSGQGFAQSVGQKLGKPGPAEFKVIQDGRSSVVAISSTSNSASDALRIVQTAIDLYGQQLAQRTDHQMQVILPALAQWEQNADDAPNGPNAQGIRQLRDHVLLQGTASSMRHDDPAADRG